MLVLNVVINLDTTSGGLSAVVRDLMTVCEEDPEVRVATLVANTGPVKQTKLISSHGSVDIASGEIPLLSVLRLIRNIKPDIVHIHGLWFLLGVYAGLSARLLGVPIIWSVHGMLEPWALKQNRLKKKIAYWFYQRHLLMCSRTIHVTSGQERKNIERLLPNADLQCIPNGIFSRKLADKKFIGNTTNFLFLSRIHEVKGLDNLLEALAQINGYKWHLKVAGSGAQGYIESLQERVRRLGLQEHVEFVGEVLDAEKDAIFDWGHVFVLPTYSENFGIVALEALDAGLPVITTVGAPWPGLNDRRCGWWIDIGVAPLQDCLNEALRCDRKELADMSIRARGFAREFDWSVLQEEFLSMYKRIAGLADHG